MTNLGFFKYAKATASLPLPQRLATDTFLKKCSRAVIIRR